MESLAVHFPVCAFLQGKVSYHVYVVNITTNCRIFDQDECQLKDQKSKYFDIKLGEGRTMMKPSLKITFEI